MAARLCTVSHGLPDPSCTTLSVAAVAGQSSRVEAPLACRDHVATVRGTGVDAAGPAPCAPEGDSDAVVVPATGVDSNFAENLSSASEPHRFAVVVSHAPLRWRARLPTT